MFAREKKSQDPSHDARQRGCEPLFISVILWKNIAMASPKKVHEMLCLCLLEEIIDEEEFVLLFEACRPSNLPYPHLANAKFSLLNKDPAEGKADFRVGKRDIRLLFDVF